MKGSQPNYQKIGDDIIQRIQNQYNIKFDQIKPQPASRFNTYYDKTPGSSTYGGIFYRNNSGGEYIESGLRRQNTPDDHLNELMNKMRVHKREIVEASKKYFAYLELTLYADSYNPVVRLSPGLMHELSEYNVTLSLDTYAQKSDVRLT